MEYAVLYLEILFSNIRVVRLSWKRWSHDAAMAAALIIHG